MAHFSKAFLRKTKLDISEDKRAMQRLRRACEGVKRSLSTQTSATIELEALKDGVDLRETLRLFQERIEAVLECPASAQRLYVDRVAFRSGTLEANEWRRIRDALRSGSY